MADKRKKCPGFVFYYEDMETLESVLTGEEYKQVMHALYVYMQTGTKPVLKGSALACFMFMKERAERYAQHYKDTCERNRQNARKRRKAEATGEGEPLAATASDGSQQNITEQNKTKQNKTEQNIAEHNIYFVSLRSTLRRKK